MLKIHYISRTELESMDSSKRIDRILRLIKEDNIVLIEGRLKSTEEAMLIRQTMGIITDNFEKFHGIEMGFFNSGHGKAFISRLKHVMAKFLLGERTGLTLIGPANIIKELRQHPGVMELHFRDDFVKKRSK